MPKVGNVDRYNPNQVRQDALPGVRVNPASPDEAFNIGPSAQRLQNTTQRTLQTIQDINDAYVKQADETLANERYAKAQAASNKMRQYLKGMVGQNAFGAKDKIDTEWSAVQKESLKGLTPNQRAILKPRLGAEYDSLNQSVNLHMGEEIPKFQVATLDTNQKAAKEKAVQNYGEPRLVGESLYVQAKSVEQRAKILGYHELDAEGNPAGKFKEELRAATSETYAGMVNQMLADNKNEQAYKFFKDVEEKILPEDRKALGERINKIALSDTAEAQAIDILNRAEDDNAAALEVENIKDEEMKKEVTRHLESQIRIRKDTFNKNESNIVEKYINGQYSEPQFFAEKNFTSPSFRTLFENSFYINNAKHNSSETYITLQRQYADIYSGSIVERNEKMLDFRRNVVAAKGKLTDRDYRKLLSFTTDKHVTDNDDNGKGTYNQGGVGWMDRVFGDNETKTQANDIFLKKIHSAKEEKDLQEAAMKAVFEMQAKNDPSSLGFVPGQEYTNQHGVVAKAVRKEDGTIDLVIQRKKK